MRRLFDVLTSGQSQSDYVGKNVKIGKYSITIDSVIAEGGFAIVYCAKMSEKGGKCALKRMFVNDEEQLSVCQREIRLMKELNGHKNVVRYMAHTIKKQPTGVYEILLLIEFCSRGHVLDLMNKRLNSGFSEQEILHIFSDTCQAIWRLHYNKTPIAHRDLKVENILINDSNNYVLCDFGSATQTILEPDKMGVNRVEEEITRFTTVQYRSPEMVDLYSGYPIGLKSDIWALGVLLYHLCFFTLPFNTQLSIQTGEVAVPDNSPFPEEMHKLINLCLQKNPKDRPDIWQLSDCTFSIMKMPNPLKNPLNFPSINLKHVASLPNQTQLNNIKQQNKPKPAKSGFNAQKLQSNPRQVVDKADEALAILKEQMKNVKLQYDSLLSDGATSQQEIIAKRSQLEQTAAQIKANYLKIQEVRRSNYTKLQPQTLVQPPHPSGAVVNCNESAKMTNSPSLPTQFNAAQVFEPSSATPVSTAGSNKRTTNCSIERLTADLTHRRAISDPTSIESILNYQKSIGDRIYSNGLTVSAFEPVKNNFGSDSTIDSQATIRNSSPHHDDDPAFDAFLAERKQTSEINTVPDNGPIYHSLNASHSVECENYENGGWVKAPDEDSSSSSSTSESETEIQHLEEQLIQSSDDSPDQFNPKLRSQTLPEIYNSCSKKEDDNDGSDPFMMAPFPACPSQVQQRDPFAAAPFHSKRTISDKNPFKSGSSFEIKPDDPFEQAPFHA